MVPRRAAAAVIVTALGLVLLFSFKTPSDSAVAASGTQGVVAVGQPSAAPTVRVDPGSTVAASPAAPSEPTTAAAAPSVARARSATAGLSAFTNSSQRTVSRSTSAAERNVAPNSLFARADSALYGAKHAGRNRIGIAGAV